MDQDDPNYHEWLAYTDKEVQDCANTPDECHIAVGAVDPYSCDATHNSDMFLGPPPQGNDGGEYSIRMPAPFRCGIRLPFSRIDVEPDRLEAVLAEAYVCPNGQTPPCEVTNIDNLSLVQAKAIVWQELANLARTAQISIAAPGFGGIACFPNRTEVRSGFSGIGTGSDLKPLGAGPMGFIGDGVRRGGWETAVNSPICGWQEPSNAPVVGP